MAKFSDYEQVAKDQKLGSSDWYEFKDGENKLRIVSEFEVNAQHYVQEEKKNYSCIGEFCEFCWKKVPRRVQFMGWAIDRASGSLVLVAVSYSVFKAIGALSKSEEYGFDSIPPYDIIVTKTGEKLETRYAVMPARKDTPLTAEEQAEIAKLKSPLDIVNKMREKNPGRLMATAKPLPNGKILKDEDIPVVKSDEDEEDVQEKINPDDIPF